MAAIEINREQFFEISKEDKPVLVDFWAPWCVYCRRLGPAYDRIANEYGDKINVVKIISPNEYNNFALTDQFLNFSFNVPFFICFSFL